jgi:hypothetical protein
MTLLASSCFFVVVSPLDFSHDFALQSRWLPMEESQQLHVVVSGLRHVLFEHLCVPLSQHYPRFAKKHGAMLLSVEEVYFLRSDGFRSEVSRAVAGSRPCVSLSFASKDLEDAFLLRLAESLHVCEVYAFLSASSQRWILRHAGATFGADFIGYRLDSNHPGAPEDAERSVRHGEVLFVVGVDGWSAGEIATALRVARSVGKRLMGVSRVAGSFEVAAVVPCL